MADITDIRGIVQSEKSLNLQQIDVITVLTSNRVTKNSLKEIFRQYFGLIPVSVNSLRMKPVAIKFKSREGVTKGYKKFYVKVPSDFDTRKLFSLEEGN